jgi:glycosyltransferase involved in cell wall biosynthesis
MSRTGDSTKGGTMKVSLLTGGGDPTYALPLCAALTSKGVGVEFIGGDAMATADSVKSANCTYYNLRGDQSPHAPLMKKIGRILTYYYKLIRYSIGTEARMFHILWPSRLWPSRVVYFERTLLNIFYKLLGRRVVYTAHNINEGERDKNDTWLNRLTLRFMYNFVDHIFVHTEKMKLQLISVFGVNDNNITVIPFGINNVVPNSAMTESDAKRALNVADHHKTLLFFGLIAPYKGLEYLVTALSLLRNKEEGWRLVIAGNIKKGHDEYWEGIQQLIRRNELDECIIQRIEFIPDNQVEWYFKGADVAVLPYRHVFQSGVLLLSYNFGLPVIAADVGALRSDIIEGETGFVVKPEDPRDLAETISRYFESDLYRNLVNNRMKIKDYANSQYSWHTIGEITRTAYEGVLNA